MAHPFPLYEAIWSPSREVLVTPEITSALEVGAAVAIGVSGGKDSAATALATIDYLEDAGHRGPRVLIHSDLGRVEWRQSRPACHGLATRLGLELIVVRRETRDLVDRWRSRWKSNVRRYAELSCVELILPWSTASMRFCTSELKTSIICRALVQRFPGQTILSATGIRRQESPNRAKAPVAKPQPKLASAPEVRFEIPCRGETNREIAWKRRSCMCPAAAPHLAPWLKERGTRPKYCFTAAMDEEIRHAYHLYVDYNNRKAIGSCARKLGLPKWLITRRGGALGLARVKEPA